MTVESSLSLGPAKYEVISHGRLVLMSKDGKGAIMSTPDGGPTLDAELQEVITKDLRGLVEEILCCRDLLHNVLHTCSGVINRFHMSATC